MESYIEYTNDEDIAMLQIVLEDYQIDHKTTSYAAQGNVIARIDIDPSKGNNPLKLGYEIHSHFETVKTYIRGDQQFPEGREVFKEEFYRKSKEYQDRYTTKIAEAKSLFKIECPPNDWIELPNGDKVLIAPEVDWEMDEEEIRKMDEGIK